MVTKYANWISEERIHVDSHLGASEKMNQSYTQQFLLAEREVYRRQYALKVFI